MKTADNVVWRRVGDDSLVLLNLETGRYNSLNRSGAIVFGAVVRGETVSGCAQALRRHYPILTAGKAQEVVTNLIDNLQKRGLLVGGEPDTLTGTTDLEFNAGGEFQLPACEEHEALQEVTAGTYSYSYSYTYYYYYYY